MPSSLFSERVEQLLTKGVRIAAPASIEVGAEVDPARIADDVTIHAGCKIFGASTSIGPGSVLGYEAPATLEDCQLGRKVQLKGGFFSGAVFLDGSAMGSCAHVRPGTILEEGAEMAHGVGLKQSIFFPFVVGGSLLNVCDWLMAGGLSRKVHSEIGSSFIHFNFTPHGDKATASLIGDVPRGVMLDQKPIFLGGQGGVTGPVRVEFGTVMGAGHILRKDVLEGEQLISPERPAPGVTAYDAVGYRSVERIVQNGIRYIANIAALQTWYDKVRRPVMAENPFTAWCHEGAMAQLAAIRKERLKRLDDVMQKIINEDADRRALLSNALQEQHARWAVAWADKKASLEALADVDCDEQDIFLQAWKKSTEEGYVGRIHALLPEIRAAGTVWLQKIVDVVM